MDGKIIRTFTSYRKFLNISNRCSIFYSHIIQSYPLNVSARQTLRKLNGSQGIDLTDTSLDAKIKTFRYESVIGSDYLLTIDVDLPEDTPMDRFLLVIPNEITRHKNRP